MKLHREHRKPCRVQDYSKRCCNSGFRNWTAKGTHLAVHWGMHKAPQTCQEPVDVVVQDCTLQNTTWQAVGRSTLMSCQPGGISAPVRSSLREICIPGRRFSDRRAPIDTNRGCTACSL